MLPAGTVHSMGAHWDRSAECIWDGCSPWVWEQSGRVFASDNACQVQLGWDLSRCCWADNRLKQGVAASCDWAADGGDEGRIAFSL